MEKTYSFKSGSLIFAAIVAVFILGVCAVSSYDLGYKRARTKTLKEADAHIETIIKNVYPDGVHPKSIYLDKE